jgi:hypothetical protein
VWRRIAFLLIMVPLALLAFVVLLLNFGTAPRDEMFYALAVVGLAAVVTVPAGITIWAFTYIMADRRRSQRKRT